MHGVRHARCAEKCWQAKETKPVDARLPEYPGSPVEEEFVETPPQPSKKKICILEDGGKREAVSLSWGS
jgi:hypothetical protein